MLLSGPSLEALSESASGPARGIEGRLPGQRPEPGALHGLSGGFRPNIHGEDVIVRAPGRFVQVPNLKQAVYGERSQVHGDQAGRD